MDTLTPLEQGILQCLAESRSTQSGVTLAIDMADRDPAHWRLGDPVGLAVFVLGSLNDRGLITYRLQNMTHAWRDADGGQHYGLDMPTQIRLTPDGWAAAGYPPQIGVVGTASRHQIPPRHPGDRTDYRTHHASAEGEHPVERLPLGAHMNLYPGHTFHTEGGPYVDDIAPADGRGYIKITADMEAAAILYRSEHPTAPYSEVADVVGLPVRTVRYILTDRAFKRGLIKGTDTESIKARVLRCVTVLGPFDSIAALRTAMATGDGQHEIIHVLHSLRKEGAIEMQEKRRGSVKDYSGIRVRKTRNVRDAEPATPEASPEEDESLPITEVHASDMDTADEVIVSHPEDPTPVVDLSTPEETTVAASAAPFTPPAEALPTESSDWPELSGLIAAERDRIDAEDRAAIYQRAAESLEHLDPEEAERLMVKAASVAPPMASRIEAEYLKFATAVLRKDGAFPVDR